MSDSVETSTDLADLLSAEDFAEITDFSRLAVDFIMNGKTIGELKGLSSEDMEVVYNVAYNTYASENYEEAHKIFKFLCYFDHLEKKHWLGLGVCRQMLKLYEQAVEAYTYAMLLDSNDPQPPLLAADCHIALGNRDAAISGLTAALEWSGDRPEYQSIRERATALLEVLNASATAAKSSADS